MQTGAIFKIQKFSIHDGPGIRTTVFLKGCPLRCAWCANPESQKREPQLLRDAQKGTEEPDSREYTIDEVVAECLKDEAFYLESGGGVTVSGGEPTVQADFLLDLLGALRQKGIHTAVETTGLAAPAIFEKVLPLCDTVLFDVKHHDSKKHELGTGVPNEAILQNLAYALRTHADVLPRIPVIPGFNDSIEDAKAFARLLLGLGAKRAQLLPFHQFGENKYALVGMAYGMKGVKALRPEDLDDYVTTMKTQGIDCFL